MRILAIVLGVVAIIGSCFTGVSYLRAKSGEQQAIADKEKAAADLALATRQADDALQGLAEKIKIEESSIESWKVWGSMCKGRPNCVNNIVEHLIEDRKKRDEDTQKLEDEESFRSSGGVDPPVAVAMDRVSACERSFEVWLTVEIRDQHFAYALLGLWVAFGFALALSRKI